MVTEYHKKLVENKLKKLLSVTKSLYEFDIETDLDFEWEPEYKTAAGMACRYRDSGVTKNLLYFNPYYLTYQTEEFLERTVPHELAHLIVYELQYRGLIPSKIESHGKEFRDVMNRLSAQDAGAHHQYDTRVIPGFESGVKFKCGDCGSDLRVSDLQAKNIHKFHCSKCKSKNIIQL